MKETNRIDIPTRIEFRNAPGAIGWLKRLRTKFLSSLDNKRDAALSYVIGTSINRQISDDRLNILLYMMQVRLKENGFDMKLPYYWGSRGPMVEWYTVQERFERIGIEVSIT